MPTPTVVVNLNKWFPLRWRAAKPIVVPVEAGITMRQVLTSFLALHWTIAFALLAVLCIDG
ncbi:hypothetical protein EN812_32770, partial [Mesorhizobium sp. M4B.F.Ca.ET.169.01.1.1]